MAEIRRRGALVEVCVARRERKALLQIVERVEPMLADSHWARPRAYEDAADEKEFRRLAAADLEESRAADIAGMRACLSSDGPIELDSEAAWGWLRALNMLRLALAEGLGLDADGWEDRFSPRQHQRPPLATLHLLSWVQEEMVAALADD